MMRANRFAFAATMLVAGLAVSAARADDFYEARLRNGEQALAAGRTREAVDNLRVASFGLLEKPSLLLASLATLAVAQTRAGRTADAEATLQRFQAAQSIFPSTAEIRIAPDVRSAFETLARQKIPGWNSSAPVARKTPAPRSESR